MKMAKGIERGTRVILLFFHYVWEHGNDTILRRMAYCRNGTNDGSSRLELDTEGQNGPMILGETPSWRMDLGMVDALGNDSLSLNQSPPIPVSLHHTQDKESS